MTGLLLATLMLAQPQDTGQWRHVTSAEGLPPGEVRAVLPSSDGTVWFAVRGEGLSQLDGGMWQDVLVNDGLASNGVAALRETGNGTLWAVGQGGYAVRHEGVWRPFTDLGGRNTRVVFSVTLSADGATQWFAASGFAARHDPDGWSHFDTTNGLPHLAVHQVWIDRTGDTWFACRRGVARLRNDTIEVFYPDVNFRSIVEDRSGRLWFGTGGSGIFTYEDGRWRRDMDGQTVLPTVVDANGHVWARTEGAGAYRYDGQSWSQMTMREGMLSDVIFDIAQAPDGSLWFATDRGASRYTPDESP